VLELLLVAVILLLVAVFVTAPLRRPRREDRGVDEDPRLVELEARKEAKYREIRDAEMDREAGKLSEEDWRRHDAELRREAIRILRQIDELEGATGKRSAG
jgi:predicted Holliday junction resolvase-like endonuclease